MGRQLSRGLRRSFTEIVLIGIASIVVIVALEAIAHLRHPVTVEDQLSTMAGPKAAVGSPIAIKSVHFSGNKLTLLLVVSPLCHFCLASRNFHEQLLRVAEEHNVPVFFAVPGRSSESAYIANFHLAGGRIKQWSELSVSLDGTPTLLAINSSGLVTRLWLGELSPPEEQAVFRAVQAPGETTLPANFNDFSPKILKELTRKQALVVIDVRERSAVTNVPKGLVNIPLQELPFRADGEIPANALALIDCRAVVDETCERGVQVLQDADRRVGTIGRGTYHASWCQATRIGSPARN